MKIKIGLPKNISVSELQKSQPEGVEIGLEIRRDLTASDYVNIFITLTSTISLNLFCQWFYDKLRMKNVKRIRINEEETELKVENFS